MGHRGRRVWGGAVASVALWVGLVAVAPAALAADVTNLVDLQAALGADDGTATLTADIGEPDARVTVPAGAARTLDLGGHRLTVGCVVLERYASLTITGTGELIADARQCGNRAGVEVPGGAALTINSGTVTATASVSAGIGGGDVGDAGNVTIRGGIVTATSTNGAGIGGGNLQDGGEVAIRGGIVTATSTYGAGIGGGIDGAGGTVTISGGTVTAGSQDGSAVGRGRGSSGGFGSLTIGEQGTLELADGARLRVPDDGVVDNAGTITGAGRIVREPEVGGMGRVENSGVITLPTSNVTPAGPEFVTGNNFLVRFATPAGPSGDSVRVFALTFATGDRSLPDGVWRTTPTLTGTQVTAATDLRPLAATPPGGGDRVVTLYQVVPDSLEVTLSPQSPRVGQPATVTVTALDGAVNVGDVTGQAIITTDDPNAVISGARSPSPPRARIR